MLGSNGWEVIKKSHGVEVFLSGAVAKCREIDEKAADHYERLGGRYNRHTLNILEADWVATNFALYYVNFMVDFFQRTEWDSIASLRLGRPYFNFRKVYISFTDGTSQKWTVGRINGEVLLEIFNKYKK